MAGMGQSTIIHSTKTNSHFENVTVIAEHKTYGNRIDIKYNNYKSTMQVQVLDTDYKTYAVVWSCMNSTINLTSSRK